MKIKTLVAMLNDYDDNDTVKIEDDCLLIGGRGGYLIRLPKTKHKPKPKTKQKPFNPAEVFPTFQDSTGDGV